MSYFRLDNIQKRFGNHEVLKGIDISVEKSETIAIIGPSGCGKTTLLRCAALLDIPDEGSIVIDGEVIASARNGAADIHYDLDAYRARVGFVFQNLNIWPHLSVLENLTLAARIVGKRSRAQAREKAHALLTKMDVAEKAQEYPSALSGGQLQRVALARALMMDPALLLLDEITSALDPELVGDVLDVVADLSVNGITLLIVTHEMQFAAEVADRLIFLDDGKIIEQGKPSDLLIEPGTARLTGFLSRLSKHRLKAEVSKLSRDPGSTA